MSFFSRNLFKSTQIITSYVIDYILCTNLFEVIAMSSK